ncbi:MAG: glycosyltransferase family 4 protein [Tetrasphaera sp.]|nr:glycosyltransferase family 4 protein [Tetrasphaera sp.]
MSEPALGPRTALWVVPVANLAGVARHVLDVAAHGIPGWRVVTLTPPGPLAEALRARGAAVLTGPFGPDHGLARSRRTLTHAAGALRPALVHTHLSYADLALASIPLAPGTVRVSTEHGIAADDAVYHAHAAQARAMALAHRVRLHRLDALIAVSGATLAAVRSKWSPPARLRTEVIPNGVDRPHPGDETRPVREGLHVVSVARLAPEKRLDALVAGFAELAKAEPTARLTLAGDGPLRADVTAQVRSAGLADRVDLPGHVNPEELLSRAHVLAQLSIWENCSYSLLDALARGLGIVATRVGGNPEVVGEAGLVADVAPATIAAALRRQGLDASARPQLSARWPTVSDMCDRLAALYDGTAGPQGRGGER